MTNHSSTDWKALFLRFETLLVAVLLAEIIIFSSTAENFATTSNSLEIIRLSVELGLLALVMTPIILTGGIDLSVGSLLGLCAISFGKLWRDGGLPPALAAICTLLIGAAAGGLNALLITRLKLPPLIVTLGSFSLFRGLAEAITRGVDNFTGFPPSFLFLGQGYFFGIIPAQLPILVLAAIGIWLLVHRTTFGRSFRAIGFSPEGTRYAGIPVEKRVGPRLCLVGRSVRAGGADLCRPRRTGESRCGNRLRTACDNRRGAWRNVDFRRDRDSARHPPRIGGACGSKEWTHPLRYAERARRHSHWRPIAMRPCWRSSHKESLSRTQTAGTKTRDSNLPT